MIILEISPLMKAVKELEYALLIKSRPTKYIRRIPDGKGGWKYIYKEGQKSVKKEKPVKQTETKAFKDWFGDSKVVDENGKPLVVYHTTNIGNLKEFKTEGEIETLAGKIKNKGAYFALDKNAYKHKGKYQYPVYLKINNPYISYDQIETAVIKPDEYKKIKDMGHDGVILRDKNNNIVEAIVFDNKQIKSATGNRGTFDPNNPDMTKAKKL